MQAEEAARQLDAELAAARSRTAQAEAQLRVQQKETAALVKALEVARGGEGSVASKAAAAEEAARKLDGDVGSLRQRVLQLEVRSAGGGGGRGGWGRRHGQTLIQKAMSYPEVALQVERYTVFLHGERFSGA